MPLEQLSYLAGLRVIAVGEDHEDIVGDEPLGSAAQGLQALRPDVSADRLFTHFEVGSRLRYGVFCGYVHGSILVDWTP